MSHPHSLKSSRKRKMFDSPTTSSSTLNPHAKEFVPRFTRSLNPHAQVFVPMGVSKEDLLISEMDNLKDQLNKMRDDVKKSKDELDLISSLYSQHVTNFNFMFPSPKIVPFNPSIPEFIVTKNTPVWKWNACNSCNSSMCEPRDFDTFTSEKLEKGFALYSQDKTNTILKYNIAGMNPYEFNYTTMIQTNMTTSRERLVERKIDVVKNKNPKWVRGPNEIHQKRTYDDQFKVVRSSVDVNPKSQEFQTIEKEFLDTTSGTNPTMRDLNYKIDKIVKTIDPINARLFEVKKSSMKTQDEAMLFHGTRGTDVIQIINDGGLDMRVGNDGGYFGRGIYTSASPYYSHINFGTLLGNTGQTVLLYTKVLLGNMKIFPDDHREGLLKAPTGFDSVSSSVDGNNTTIYTVYDNHQVYISYMIYYSRI